MAPSRSVYKCLLDRFLVDEMAHDDTQSSQEAGRRPSGKNSTSPSSMAVSNKSPRAKQQPINEDSGKKLSPIDTILPVLAEKPAEELTRCPVCNRTFFPASLQRHITICVQSSTRQRRTFDSSKQRVQGEAASFARKALEQSATTGQHSPKGEKKIGGKWRERHRLFLQAVRAARGRNSSDPDGTVAGPPSVTLPSDYEQCPYCARNFGPKSYDRHVEFCKEQSTRLHQQPCVNPGALERLQARKNYKAPLPGSSKKTGKEKKQDRASLMAGRSGRHPPQHPGPPKFSRASHPAVGRGAADMTRTPVKSPYTSSKSSASSLSRNQTGRNSTRTTTDRSKCSPSKAMSKMVPSRVLERTPNKVTKPGLKSTSHHRVGSKDVHEVQPVGMRGIGDAPMVYGFATGTQKKSARVAEVRARSRSVMTAKEYDPYRTAERQMEELMSLTSAWPTPAPTPAPHPLLNSHPQSAFSPYRPHNLTPPPTPPMLSHDDPLAHEEVIAALLGLTAPTKSPTRQLSRSQVVPPPSHNLKKHGKQAVVAPPAISQLLEETSPLQSVLVRPSPTLVTWKSQQQQRRDEDDEDYDEGDRRKEHQSKAWSWSEQDGKRQSNGSRIGGDSAYSSLGRQQSRDLQRTNSTSSSEGGTTLAPQAKTESMVALARNRNVCRELNFEAEEARVAAEEERQKPTTEDEVRLPLSRVLASDVKVAKVGPLGPGMARFGKYCHQCGFKHPVETAKFCIDCGIRRINF